jgi:CHAT domain-containing protein/tetratricopeptide (TPR) repeat protein
MSFIKISLSWLLACALASPVAALNAQTSDEAALRNLVSQYFGAYARKDTDALKAVWSERSPDAAQNLKYLQRVFAAAGAIDLAGLNVVRLEINGDKAYVRAALELNVIQAKTGRLVPGFGKINRALGFIKEAGVWKLWREVSYEQEVSARLAAANSDAERQQLLAQEKGLVISELARTLNEQGMRIDNQGDFQRALSIFDLALKFIEQADFKPGIIRVLNNIGDTRRRLGDYTESLRYLQKSLALAREIDDQELVGITQVNIGNLYFLWGNYAAALSSYNQGLQIGEALNNKVIIGNSLNNIANVYNVQGNYQLALEYLKKSLPIKEEAGNKIALARTFNNIGEVNARQGDYAQALEYYKRSLVLKEEADDKADLAPTYNNIGMVRREQGDYARALENFNRALSISESAGDRNTTIDALYAIALVEKLQGNYEQSLKTAERAAALARQLNEPESLWELSSLMGEDYLGLKQTNEAHRAFEESIAVIETLRSQVAGGEQEQQRFFEKKISPYREMLKLLVSEEKTAEAFTYAERAKARVLLDVLQSGRVNITKAMRPEEQARERTLMSEISALNAQTMREETRPAPDAARLADLKARLQKARLEREAFETNLYAAHPDLKGKRGQAQPIKLEETRELLTDNRTALLEFALADEGVYLFVLTKNNQSVELKTYTLKMNAKELAERAEAFRKSLAERNLDFRANARALYDALLAPAQKQLEGKTSLIIVPDGMLWNLPFQALRSPKEKYLIEDYAVSYAPSLTVLREMTMKPRPNTTVEAQNGSLLLAFGNPAVGKQTSERVKYTLMDGGLPQLPEAEKQVNILAQVYGQAQSRIYTGASASEDKAKSEAGRFRVLQFATHAVLNDSNPLYSYVVLSQPANNTEDGLLEAWEMMNLDLNADMVVLSACETARGRIGAGEGVIGMTWALFVAGSPTTVVSQWKVESASTTELMLAFHRALRAQNARTSKAQAMQAAALKLLRSSDYQHPFYWAGFVIIGDAR